jgi:hypothetical protein
VDEVEVVEVVVVLVVVVEVVDVVIVVLVPTRRRTTGGITAAAKTNIAMHNAHRILGSKLADLQRVHNLL